MKTYQQLWQSLTPLYDAGEAQAIVRTVLDVEYGMTLTDIICGKVNELSADEGRKLEEIIIRLQKGEPVQYVLGEADFAGRPFHVEPGVLIPRPETAELCQWIEEDMAVKSTVSSEDFSEDSPQATDDARQILDICTGSGCIAITLGLNIPNSEVTGWDISEDALRIAQGNVEMLKARNVRIEYQDALALQKAAETDNEKMKVNADKEVVKPKGEAKTLIRSPTKLKFVLVVKPKGKAKTPSTQKWDMIVSNPPYICEKEKADMEKNVLEHEPSIALFVPDENPLKFYRAIAEYASSALKPGGALYFEINPIYEKETRKMLQSLGFKDIETKEDAFGKKRMMRAKSTK